MILKNRQQSYLKSPTINRLLGGFALLLLSACSEQAVEKLEGAAQGTTYHISYWSQTPVDSKAIADSITARFASLDKTLSNYRPDSTIETFNTTETTDSLAVGPEIVQLVRIARTVYEASAACYDLSIKPLFELWGFRGESLTIPDDTTLSNTLARIGMNKLEVVDDTHLRKTQADLKIDLSSIAQGYSVAAISAVLEQHGISNYLVEIGGELKTLGQKPNATAWRVAVERPLPNQQVMHKIISLPKDSAMAVMTSGTYRHYFDANGIRYSHILDARSGRPVSHDLVSVSVIYPDPTLADAWSTALLCLGQTEGLKAANTAKIPALFIQQQDQNLLETKSDALTALTTVVFH